LTSMLRQRIMPPSPLTLHPNSGGAAANSGFADGFNAAAAALASPFSASRYSSSGGGGGGHGVGSAYPFSPSTLSNYATSNAALTRRSMTAPHHGTGALHHHHHHHHGAGSGGGNHFHGTHFATTRGTPSPLHPPPQSPFRYPPPGSPFTANKSSCLDLVPFHNNEVDVNNNSNNGERGLLDWPSSPHELFGTSPDDPFSIERAARLYRNAATICEATCTWSGVLPPRIYRNPIYSCKVFIGGVPWDITEIGLLNTFKCYGNLRIEWPGKDGKHPKYPPKGGPKGYVYILFDCDKSVKELLKQCTHDYSNGGEYYYKMSSRRMRCKEVQVIPWVLTDSNFIRCPSQRLDPQKTVFVGALHGMLNSEALATIFNDLFGGVVYAGVDTDKYKYPIGSGRVTFNNHKSFMRAVNAAFIEVKTAKFTKKIQVDPYLEDSPCCLCNSGAPGPYFCRELQCFKYYCRPCWVWQHGADANRHHKPLMRNSKTPSAFGVANAFGGLAAGTLGTLMAGMTTFSSTNHETLECEEFDAGGRTNRPDLSAPPPLPPPPPPAPRSASHSQTPGQDDVYAMAASGFENAYVNALCAELSNMIQFNDNNNNNSAKNNSDNSNNARRDQNNNPLTTESQYGRKLGGPSMSGLLEHPSTGLLGHPPTTSARSSFRPTSVDDLFSAAAAAAVSSSSAPATSIGDRRF